MLVFRFGKDLEKIGFCEGRVVFQDAGGEGRTNRPPSRYADIPRLSAADIAALTAAPGSRQKTPGVAALIAAPVPGAKASNAEEFVGPLLPEAPAVPVAAEAAVAAESVRDRGETKAELQADADREKLQATLGADFETGVNIFGAGGISGDIKLAHVDPATLTFTPEFKGEIELLVRKVIEGVDMDKAKKVFDKHYKETGDVGKFGDTYTRMMVAVTTADLQKKVKDLGLDKFAEYKEGKTTIKYKIVDAGAVTLEVVDDTGKYLEFKKQQEAKALKEGKKTQEVIDAEKEEMVKAIKENGGWIGGLFLAFAKSSKDKNGKTLIDRLYDGEVPALSFAFGMRGVNYGPFKEMADNVKESAGDDPRISSLFGKAEKLIGKGKGAALKEMNDLFDNTTGLSLESFSTYFDGSKALDQAYAIKDGYAAAEGKILEITLPKNENSEKMLVPPNQDYTVAIGNTAPLAEKKGDAKPATIEAPATRTLVVRATQLPPKTILPKGTIVKEIAA